jgi:hypothetical protein
MLPGLGTLLTIRNGISGEILFACKKEVIETYSRCHSRTDSIEGGYFRSNGVMPPLYGGETHMLMVAEIVIGDRFYTSPAYVLHAKYWVVDWARPTSLMAHRFKTTSQYLFISFKTDTFDFSIALFKKYVVGRSAVMSYLEKNYWYLVQTHTDKRPSSSNILYYCNIQHSILQYLFPKKVQLAL